MIGFLELVCIRSLGLSVKQHLFTFMSRCMKPLRWRAGLRCGYSSVLVTVIPHTLFQASYSWLCMG